MKTTTLALTALSAFAFGGCVSKPAHLSDASVPDMVLAPPALVIPREPKFPLQSLPPQAGMVVEQKTSRVFVVEVGPERTRRLVFFSQPTEVGKSVSVMSYIVDGDPASIFYEGQ